MTLHVEVKFRTLTKVDRCDRCGASAKTLVKTPSGELLFCGHHFAENAATIVSKGYFFAGSTDDE